MLHAFILLPLASLLYVPFVRLAARWLVLERLTFGAAFQLGMFIGAAGLLASVVVLPFAAYDRTLTAAGLILVLLAVSSAICGYYVVTPEGRSVGMRKGLYLATVSQALLVATLVAVSGLFMLLSGYRP